MSQPVSVSGADETAAVMRGVQAMQRIFSPIAAVRITNHLHDEPGVQEILVAGHEANIASIKLYQESNDRYTRIDIPSPLLSDIAPKELGGQTPAIPGDAFHALGHEGQCLTVIPSRRLVVVRLGLSIDIKAWNHAAFLSDILAALPV